jgi:hypothetical protein
MLFLRDSLPHPTIPSIFVGWDNTPRRGDKAIVMTDADPDYFQSKLSSLIGEQLIKPSSEQLVFINAWNLIRC